MRLTESECGGQREGTGHTASRFSLCPPEEPGPGSAGRCMFSAVAAGKEQSKRYSIYEVDVLVASGGFSAAAHARGPLSQSCPVFPAVPLRLQWAFPAALRCRGRLGCRSGCDVCGSHVPLLHPSGTSVTSVLCPLTSDLREAVPLPLLCLLRALGGAEAQAHTQTCSHVHTPSLLLHLPPAAQEYS